MLDLATLGAGVLHNRSVEMAKKYGVPLVVRSSLNNSEGTVVKEEVTVERMLISGVALDTDAVRIAVIGLKDSPGVAFKLFDTLAKKNNQCGYDPSVYRPCRNQGHFLYC